MTSSPAVGSGTQPRAAREPGRALTRTRGRGGHRHGQRGPGEAPGAGGTGSGLERGVHGEEDKKREARAYGIFKFLQKPVCVRQGMQLTAVRKKMTE